MLTRRVDAFGGRPTAMDILRSRRGRATPAETANTAATARTPSTAGGDKGRYVQQDILFFEHKIREYLYGVEAKKVVV